MKVASIVGARPQFIKAAPVSAVLRRHHTEVLIHTGQHYDDEMSAAFFRSLRIPEPEHHLGIGSGPHGEQTGRMLVEIERVLLADPPDTVLVYGDTNSTLAAALAAAKLHLPLAHVEAGLRSHNRTMPEEINRVVADHLSSLLFCPTQNAVEELAVEGIRAGVHLVGDVMYDVALATAQEARQRDVLARLGLRKKEYLLCTVHRPSNTDDARNLASILEALAKCGRRVVFPVHPRTKKRIEEHKLGKNVGENVLVTEPLDYLDFQALLMESAKVLTDSGGVQKEAYFFGVPCITLRDETEWIETVEDGWNVLVGADTAEILRAVAEFNPSGTQNKSFGDGRAAEKIVEILTGGR
ncbi:MAG TPA: UDP-N-acetylglucosamine 2-epimerase (non-hydrolyzing) [Thermoplasmata archaeon]|nr:UDP-N-acetylglucosamine 2-epimerase (non-hydrolyzing) [Thermoplasmata archaeon]